MARMARSLAYDGFVDVGDVYMYGAGRDEMVLPVPRTFGVRLVGRLPACCSVLAAREHRNASLFSPRCKL